VPRHTNSRRNETNVRNLGSQKLGNAITRTKRGGGPRSRFQKNIKTFGTLQGQRDEDRVKYEWHDKVPLCRFKSDDGNQVTRQWGNQTTGMSR
jgi:hypothetical protein